MSAAGSVASLGSHVPYSYSRSVGGKSIEKALVISQAGVVRLIMLCLQFMVALVEFGQTVNI